MAPISLLFFREFLLTSSRSLILFLMQGWFYLLRVSVIYISFIKFQSYFFQICQISYMVTCFLVYALLFPFKYSKQCCFLGCIWYFPIFIDSVGCSHRFPFTENSLPVLGQLVLWLYIMLTTNLKYVKPMMQVSHCRLDFASLPLRLGALAAWDHLKQLHRWGSLDYPQTMGIWVRNSWFTSDSNFPGGGDINKFYSWCG